MYCTPEDVIEMLIPDIRNQIIGEGFIEDPEEQLAKLTPLVEESIRSADAEINGYLAKRYELPLSKVPENISKYSKDIAVFNLFSRIGIDQGERESVYMTRYKNAIRYLETVVKGVVDLGLKPVGQVASTGFQMSSSPRLFSRKSMRGM
jgi:phage gp36-like protein